MSDFFTFFDLWKALEFAAMVTGLVYVFLEIKKTRSMWRWMIISSLFNIFVFWHKGFLSMTLIQFYYIVTAVYGIVTWTRVVRTAQKKFGPEHHNEVAVVPFAPKKAAVSIVAAVAVFALLAFLSVRSYVPSPGDIPGKPYWDSAVAVLSMLATYWLSQSWFAQWYIWLIVNASAIVMFFYPVCMGHSENALTLIGVVYIIYMATTVAGIINWKRNGVIIKESEMK